ncbi:hypothetical protein MANY_33500 [Mycolicibacterium anyangense]|uniref:DUF6779 domain-containing protein n=1 Tax=Mycolicibacterium anyangense TaxID=1431246 RepID=A0A6N4WCB5_9MYCO|nr:DUF6779 domain-containing protein [Mycolicibacterium anyangense]BBZ78013.1 hypothetical protein MANY_33500 [Mycolicibacterium anyangense]
MTVLSRGGRNRRGGRRPGWLLLTTLLVLAIVASSALVFTNRVELLKLAVVLSLWAAVVAAFVSVIYRRQSDVDAARARDLKLVYDLQLDREISARREYELGVESHLRRELAAELRAQAADEVAALRAELAALRANLEILFDADLGDRPALEGDRAAAGYGDWTRDTTAMPPTPGRVQSSRITPVTAEDNASRTAENPIIDVPEEPLVPPPPAPAPRQQPAAQQQQPYAPPPPRPRYQEPPPPQDYDDYRGSHRRPAGNGAGPAAPPVQPTPVPAPPQPAPAPAAQSSEWQPVEAEGRWLPPGTPGSTWVSPPVDSAPTPEEARRGRHWTGPVDEPPAPAPPRPEPARPEPVMQPAAEPAAPRARHSVEAPAYGQAAPAMSTPPPPESGGRRRRPEPEPEPEPQPEPEPEPPAGPGGQHAGGQSVADLLARLQANGNTGSGGRRRRED